MITIECHLDTNPGSDVRACLTPSIILHIYLFYLSLRCLRSYACNSVVSAERNSLKCNNSHSIYSHEKESINSKVLLIRTK